MTTITDPRNVVVLTNTYDANGKVATQTLGDGQSTYSFAYTPSPGEVTQADVTDPRGKIHRMTFNADGYLTAETRALGTADQQSIRTHPVRLGAGPRGRMAPLAGKGFRCAGTAAAAAWGGRNGGSMKDIDVGPSGAHRL